MSQPSSPAKPFASLDAPSTTLPLTEAIKSDSERILDRRKELLGRVKLLREHALTGRGRVVGGDSNKDYVWVNVHTERQIAFQGMDYEVCRDPKVTTPWVQSDLSHRRGDLILYQVPKDMREVIKLDEEWRALEAVNPKAAEAKLHDFVSREGAGAVFIPTPRN